MDILFLRSDVLRLRKKDFVVLDKHLVRKDGPPEYSRPQKPKPILKNNEINKK